MKESLIYLAGIMFCLDSSSVYQARAWHIDTPLKYTGGYWVTPYNFILFYYMAAVLKRRNQRI